MTDKIVSKPLFIEMLNLRNVFLIFAQKPSVRSALHLNQ